MAGVAALILAANLIEPEYAYIPAMSKVQNPQRGNLDQAYDLWGRSISREEAITLLKTEEGRKLLSPENGAIRVDEDLRELGRRAFYAETFNNEDFFSEVMGVVHGPITIWDYAKAIVGLRGQGTTDLKVKLSRDATVAGRTYRKGQEVSTGFDIPKGAWAPIGMKVKFARNRLQVGLTCASCHVAVDPTTRKVVEGATNHDFNAGELIALAPNSSAYFTHSGIETLERFVRGSDRLVPTADGGKAALPDPQKLEDAVDRSLITWPPGTFDTANDLKNDPVKIPHVFTLDVHPYSWSGFGMAGSFKGLNAINNNVHAKSADPTTQTDQAPALYGLDREVYLGTILQNAVNPKFRYDPASGERPTQFFARVDPTPGAPGMSEVVVPPNYPRATLLSTVSVLVSSPGTRVWEQVSGMSAFQNSLVPPPPKAGLNPEQVAQGRAVFREAGCLVCHSGPTFTNHRILSATQLGLTTGRSSALRGTQRLWGEPLLYAPDTPVPIPPDALVLRVPTAELDPQQVGLALGWIDKGGYKVKDLIALDLSAPYLHDAGVAMGPDPETQAGLPGTVLKGVTPDPANSLRALLDQEWRARVLKANNKPNILAAGQVRGQGHTFYVDESTGFTRDEQDALIQYLLSLQAMRAGVR